MFIYFADVDIMTLYRVIRYTQLDMHAIVHLACRQADLDIKSHGFLGRRYM
jgi:hypothetical protein